MPARRAIRWKITAFILTAASLYLIGNARVSLWDRDEPRYAQASRQMLQSGDWVVPHFLDEVRAAKPVFIYWCQAAAMSVMGDNAFAARFPSSLAITLTLIGLAIVVYGAVGPQRALWTVFILGSSGIVIFSAKICSTDAVLLLFVTAAQICLYAWWRGSRSWSVVIVMAIAIGLAGLTKGPVVLGVMAATALVLLALRALGRHSDARQLHVSIPQIVAMLIVILAICGPWLYLMQQRVPDYLRLTLWKEIFDRARTPAEGHKGPPGYYLLSIWATYFPWSLLLPAAIVQAWKRRRIPQIRFALAAVIGPWIMFELIATKLPHYLLPIFPPLAFLTADMLVRAGRKLHEDITNRGFVRIVEFWGLLVVMVALVPWISIVMFKNESPPAAWWWLFVLTIICIEYARDVIAQFRARQPTRAAAVMGIGMMIFVAAFYGGYLKHAGYLQLSKRLAGVLRANDARNVMMIGYKEPSLAFYQGGTIREERDNIFLRIHAIEDWPEWIILPASLWNATPARIRQNFDLIDSVTGWNYSNRGQIVDVLVLKKKGPGPNE